MIKYIKALLIIAAILLDYSKSNAQHVGSIENFVISAQYLNSGKIKVTKTGGFTDIKYTVTFVRSYIPGTSNFSPFDMTVGITTPANNTTLNILNQPVRVTSKDFGSTSTRLEKEFTAHIDNSLLNENQPVNLTYALNGTSTPLRAYENRSYYPIFNWTDPVTEPGGGGGNKFPENDPRYIKPNVEFIAKLGQEIARNGEYVLVFGSDGNMVLYKENPYTVLWASSTVIEGGKLFFRNDGFVCILDPQGNVKWRANGDNNNAYPNCWWILQTDGNFVGYQSYRTAADGTVTPYGAAFAATGTANGKRSSHFGRLVIL